MSKSTKTTEVVGLWLDSIGGPEPKWIVALEDHDENHVCSFTKTVSVHDQDEYEDAKAAAIELAVSKGYDVIEASDEGPSQCIYRNNVADIRKAYENASGDWTGCDWPTGDDYIEDLDGMTAAEAREKQSECGDEIDEASGKHLLDLWDKAIAYLENCESNASGAEEAAAEAMAAVERGDLQKAVERIDYACHLESEFGDSPIWGPVSKAIHAAWDATAE